MMVYFTIRRNAMPSLHRVFWIVLTLLIAFGAIALVSTFITPAIASPPDRPSAPGDIAVLAWNDLGMHCYNRDFNDLAVLPPANSLWAQVIRNGNPPRVITTGVTVEYFFADNTDSTSKSNFWSTNPYTPVQNAQKLFGMSSPLPANMGLAGKGLSGTMDLQSDHFEAKWIPLTEYSDSNPTVRDPYQLAAVIVRDANTHAELARTTVVAPVSTEMHCDTCHYNDGPGNEGISSPTVEQNILKKHDEENMDEYPAGHRGALMNRRPVLCAECHSSNAIGAAGAGDVPSLSKAMHEKHADKVPNTMAGCYNCHPGPQTKCLRDVMSVLPAPNTQTCITCHGNMEAVSQNPQPWLKEPRCDTCHNNGKYNQNQALYRMSTEHGGLYCEACHDSTHAIAPSTLPNKDGLKFYQLQGHNGPIDACNVCHASLPTGAGPHGIVAPQTRSFTFTPNNRSSAPDPGATVIYTHTLLNTGNLSDTYQLQWSSTQSWNTITATTPITLTAGQQSLVTVTVNVPGGSGSVGQRDTTLITATSLINPSLQHVVTDFTLVPRARIFLPIILR
jgi:hypothetical protein